MPKALTSRVKADYDRARLKAFFNRLRAALIGPFKEDKTLNKLLRI